MILLEDTSTLILSLLTDRLSKPSNVDQLFTDFDGVSYHLSAPEKGNRSIVVLSMCMRSACWKELLEYGTLETLRREYGDYLQSEAEGPTYRSDGSQFNWDVTLKFDIGPDGIGKLPEEEAKEAVRKLSMLKRNAMAAPFERAFTLQKELEAAGAPPQNSEEGGKPSEHLMAVHYREEEGIFVIPSDDRVTVIFSTVFREETDRVFGKVFLQEFNDARKASALQSAPQVRFSNREPPSEIRHLPGLSSNENVGYVTFVLFPRHFQNADVAARTISQIQLFRDYLHYHIKCSKAYMHSRMRARVAASLKILNRAKPEVAEKEKKTASGRSFVRA